MRNISKSKHILKKKGKWRERKKSNEWMIKNEVRRRKTRVYRVGQREGEREKTRKRQQKRER